MFVLVAALVASSLALNEECTICGIVVNTIEGLAGENLMEKEIERVLNSTLCSRLDADLKKVCDKLSQEVPVIIKSLQAHEPASVICKKLGHCPEEGPRADFTPVGHYVINLDLPPSERMKEVWAVPAYKQGVQEIFNFLKKLMVKDEQAILNDLGMRLLKQYPDEFAQEIIGGAPVLGLPAGLLAIVQLAYELSEACTSIVAQTSSGRIVHARNMDFGIGGGLTGALRNMTLELDFQRGGATAYKITAFPAIVGALTGMRPGSFAATINTRFTNHTHGNIWTAMKSLAEAILHADAGQMLTTFLLRRTLESAANWKDAVTMLHNQTLVDPVYFTVSGVNPGEGAVLTRNLTGGDIYTLDPANGRWYVLQTNYDRWSNAPWDDDRRYYANQAMEKMGSQNVTFAGLVNVLSTKPVLNLETIYTITAAAVNNTLDTWVRYCNEPCPQ